MDQLRVVDLAPSAVVTVASALSPGSLLFPFSDSGFASLSAASSSRSLSLPPPISSSSSSVADSSPLFPSLLLFFLLFLLLLLFPLFLLIFLRILLPPFAPISLRRLLSLLLVSPPLPPSTSAPLFSSSLLPGPSASSSYPSLPSFSSTPSGVPVASLVVSSSSSSPSFSSSSLDFSAYQALMLGLSHDYQSVAHWYFQSGGSDFRAYLSAFYLHLSSDASRDFTSGSSVFFSALRSIASSVPLPPSSSLLPPPLPPPVSSAALAFPQPPAPPPQAQAFPPPSSVPRAPSLGPFLAALGWGTSALGSSVVVSSAPPGFPPLSAPYSSLFSMPPAPSSSLAPAAPFLALPPLLGFLRCLVLRLREWVLLRRFRLVLRLLRILSLPSFVPLRSLSLYQCPLCPLQLHLAPLRVSQVLPPLPLAPLPALQASLMLQALRLQCLRRLVPLRIPLLRLCRLSLTLQMIPLLLVLPIRRLQVLWSRILRLLCLHRFTTPFALRSGACTNIWLTSSRWLRVRRRLRLLPARSLRTSLLHRRLLTNLCTLRGLRWSAPLSLRPTPVSLRCWRVVVHRLRCCLLVQLSIL